jgi:hypothetical protein
MMDQKDILERKDKSEVRCATKKSGEGKQYIVSPR